MIDILVTTSNLALLVNGLPRVVLLVIPRPHRAAGRHITGVLQHGLCMQQTLAPSLRDRK